MNWLCAWSQTKTWRVYTIKATSNRLLEWLTINIAKHKLYHDAILFIYSMNCINNNVWACLKFLIMATVFTLWFTTCLGANTVNCDLILWNTVGISSRLGQDILLAICWEWLHWDSFFRWQNIQGINIINIVKTYYWSSKTWHWNLTTVVLPGRKWLWNIFIGEDTWPHWYEISINMVLPMSLCLARLSEVFFVSCFLQ